MSDVELAASARRAVLDRLAKAHDHFAEEEQRLSGQDRYTEAAGAHQYTLYVIRAYHAELNDPRPKEIAE